MTYQKRVTLFIISFLVVIIITLAGFIYFETSSIINDNSEALMYEKLNRIADNAESTIELNKEKIDSLSKDDALIEAIENDHLNQYLIKTLEAENLYDHYYNLLYFVSLDGTVTHASSPDAINLSIKDREYFELTKMLDDTVISDAIISKSDANFVIVFMAPVKDGDTIGYLGLTLYSDKITNFIEEIKLGDSGYFIIVDSNHKVLSHKDKEAFNKDYTYSLEERSYLEDGALHLTQAIDLEGHLWTAIAVMDEKEVLENSRNLLLYIVGLGLIFLALSIFVSMYLANLLTKPLGDLTRLIKQISQGDKKYDEALSSELESFAISVIGMQTKNIVEVNDLKEALFSMKQYIHTGISKSNLEEEKIYSRYMLLVSQKLHIPMVIIANLIQKLSFDMEGEEVYYIENLEKEFSKLEKELYTTLEDVKTINYEEILIKKKISIDALYENLLKLSETYVNSNDRIFSIEIDDSLLMKQTIDLDLKMMINVWQSFLYNAVRYTEIRGEIVFKLYQEEDQLRFELMDHGIGMPLEHIDDLYDNLYETDENDLSTFSLFISKKILDAHGLYLGIRSLEEHYTRVWFEIPLSNLGD